jgi:hypothetical protein
MTPVQYNFQPIVEGDTAQAYTFSFSGAGALTECKSQLRDRFGNLVREFEVNLSGETVSYPAWQDSAVKKGTYYYDLEILSDELGRITPVSGLQVILPQQTR